MRLQFYQLVFTMSHILREEQFVFSVSENISHLEEILSCLLCGPSFFCDNTFSPSPPPPSPPPPLLIFQFFQYDSSNAFGPNISSFKLPIPLRNAKVYSVENLRTLYQVTYNYIESKTSLYFLKLNRVNADLDSKKDTMWNK